MDEQEGEKDKEQEKNPNDGDASMHSNDKEKSKDNDIQNVSKENDMQQGAQSQPIISTDFMSYSPFGVKKDDKLNTAFIQGMEDDSMLSNEDKKYISFDLTKETEKINLEKENDEKGSKDS